MVDQMLKNAMKQFYVFSEIIILIQQIIYTFNKIIILIQRIIYIFNELFTYSTKELFSFNQLNIFIHRMNWNIFIEPNSHQTYGQRNINLKIEI